jgi:type III secretion protein J
MFGMAVGLFVRVGDGLGGCVSRLCRWLSCMLLVAGLTACSNSVDLLASIPEPDANEIIAALLNAGIPASKVAGKEGNVGVRVDASRAANAIDTLRTLGLPREHFAGMGQVFKKDGLISSPTEERARYLYALSQDLSATLSRIDGVLYARVHLVLPEKGRVTEDETPSTAAVFIKHQQDIDLQMLQPQVRRMVVNSIPNLASERVSIVLVPSRAEPVRTQMAWGSVMGIPVEADKALALSILLTSLGMLALVGIGSAGYLAWRHVYLPRKAAATETAQAVDE